MRIDSHQHFWKFNASRDAWITEEMQVLRRDYLPSDLFTELSANRMDASIAVQADQSEEETQFLLEQAERHDFVAGVVGWVDLRADDVGHRLEHFSRFEKLRGFRHVAQSEPDDRFLAREDFVHGVARLGEFGFTYEILIYPRQLPAAIELVEKTPNQAFVLDHIAKPRVKTREIAEWEDGIRRLAANPNVFCKLSGLITEADWNNWLPGDFYPYLDVVFDAFGANRLMFGSDWPVCLLAGRYAQVKDLIEHYVQEHASDQFEAIFGLNAARFYRLTVPANHFYSVNTP